MRRLAIPTALLVFTAMLSACATTPPADGARRETREATTGSNIPRRDPQSPSDAKVLDKDAIGDLIHSNGPRGKPGG